jgi:hypothetical protein
LRRPFSLGIEQQHGANIARKCRRCSDFLNVYMGFCNRG